MTNNERIENMDGILFALSLEVSLLQLNILEGCTNFRNQIQKPANKTERLQRVKLLKDRETIKNVLRRTLIEVLENGECQTLQTATEYFKLRESSALNKKLDQEKLMMLVTKTHDRLFYLFIRSLYTIIEELNVKRKKWRADLQDMDNKIPILRDKINNDFDNVNARMSYAEKWMLASTESLELEYDVQRPSVPRLEYEQRVHKELIKMYELQIKEHEDSLEYWQQRYFNDVSNINENLKLKMEHLKITSNRRIELQKMYALHEGEIRGWLTFKRERAARLAREERHRASATRIQAWWRGVMVRRAIGAFKHLRNTKKSAIKSKKKYPIFYFP